jgi:hypothetical protein
MEDSSECFGAIVAGKRGNDFWVLGSRSVCQRLDVEMMEVLLT